MCVRVCVGEGKQLWPKRKRSSFIFGESVNVGCFWNSCARKRTGLWFSEKILRKKMNRIPSPRLLPMAYGRHQFKKWTKKIIQRAWKMDMNGGKDAQPRVKIEGIQRVIPTLWLFLKPSMKMKVRLRKRRCKNIVQISLHEERRWYQRVSKVGELVW